MMRKLLLLLLVFAIPLASRGQGQGYVQMTGTKACYGNGSVQAAFVNQSGSNQLPLLNGSVFPTTGVTNFNSQGQFSFYLADNSQVLPGPSQWTITTCGKGGAQPPCGTFQVSVNGPGPIDVSSQMIPFSCPATGGPSLGCPSGIQGQLQFNSSGACGGAGTAMYNGSTDIVSAKVGLNSNGTAAGGGYLANRSDAVDAISDLHATGAGNLATCGVTNFYLNPSACHDDFAVINAYINNTANAGHNVLFPKTTTVFGRCDYYFSQQIYFQDDISAIGGTGAGMTSSATVNLCFAEGQSGPVVGQRSNFKNFGIWGGDPFNYADIRTYVLSQRDGGTGPNADGLTIQSNSYVRDVLVENFARDCYLVTSAGAGIPVKSGDAATVMNVFAQGCRGHGFDNTGTDAQVGIRGNIFSRNNQMYGIYGAQEYANVYLSGNTSGNHDARGLSIAPGGNPAAQPGYTALAGSIASINCAAATSKSLQQYTCTVTMDTANPLYARIENYMSHDLSANDLITIQGTGTALDGHVYYIRMAGNGTGTPPVTTTTFTFDYTGVLTAGPGGTVSYNPGQRIWAMAGNIYGRGGGWGQNPAGSSLGLVLMPYSEGTDVFNNFQNLTSASIVINPLGQAPYASGGIQLAASNFSLLLPENVIMRGSNNLSTYFGGYTEGNWSPTVWTAQNFDYNNLATTAYSKNTFRRIGVSNSSVSNSYGQNPGWWSFSQGNNAPYQISMKNGVSLGVGDQLTTTGRSNADTTGNQVWMPQGFFFGNSTSGNNPDCKWDTGTGPPTTDNWQVCDMIVNINYNGSNPWAWVCTGAGTPGTWTAVSPSTGGGVQSASAPGCSTASNSYSSCTSPVTWPSSFADANYQANCTAVNPSQGQSGCSGGAGCQAGVVNGYQNKTASGVTVVFSTQAGSVATAASFDCIARHP